MARAIDADGMKNAIREWQKSLTDFRTLEEVVDGQPTIEAEPVKHGKWVDSGEKLACGIIKPFTISCSVCGSSQGATWMKYCPNCGAKMQG